MRVLVTGASGFVGGAVCEALGSRGDEVLRLSRSARGPGWVEWHPERGRADLAEVGAIDAVVHLAGESIFGLRWTTAKKRQIRESRVLGTRLLCEALARLESKPRVLVHASAIGYYGSRGDEELTEESLPGTDFLAQVALEWEQAVSPARAARIRTVGLRIGVVLSPSGGALKMMLPAFRFGLGGRIGNGKQWMSWIALDDLVAIILAAIDDTEMRGVYNAVAANPVTNAEFTRALGAALSRPTPFPLPAPLVRLTLGEMGEALLLSSTRVLSKRDGVRRSQNDIEEVLKGFNLV